MLAAGGDPTCLHLTRPAIPESRPAALLLTWVVPAQYQRTAGGGEEERGGDGRPDLPVLVLGGGRAGRVHDVRLGTRNCGEEAEERGGQRRSLVFWKASFFSKCTRPDLERTKVPIPVDHTTGEHALSQHRSSFLHIFTTNMGTVSRATTEMHYNLLLEPVVAETLWVEATTTE